MEENKTTDTKNTALTPVKSFELTLEKYRQNINDLIKSTGISPSEFMVIAVNAVKKNPKLLECDKGSLFGAILTAAELGLPPNTPSQLSYIIPYKRKYKDGGIWKEINEAQFQIGYQGHLELMYRNPNVVDVETSIVYEKDEFEVVKGEDKKIIHKPHRGVDRGKRIATYAIVYLKGAAKPKFVVLYDYEIEKFKKISQSATYDSSPWKDEDKDPMGWMWRKTAIKQIAKEIPKTKAIERALHVDNAMETGARLQATEDGEAVVIENEDFKLEQKNEAHVDASQERSDRTMEETQGKIFKNKDQKFPKDE